MSDERPPGDDDDLPPPVAPLRPLPDAPASKGPASKEHGEDSGASAGDQGEEDDDGDEPVDNVVAFPGMSSLPEPSPIRHGGPPRRPRIVDAEIEEEAGLEDLDASEPPPLHMLDAAIEAVIFAADRPLSETRIDSFLGNPGVAEVRAALDLLSRRYSEQGGGVRLVQVAKGWQLRTDPRFATWVAAMRGGKPTKLSRAALEVLSIVAYRQPVTKSEIDGLRGVDSGGVLRMLVERTLVAVTGRKDEPGRPLLYGSTPSFLSLFGLRDLSDLPTLRDLRELQDDDPRLGPLGQESSGPQQLPLPAGAEDQEEEEEEEEELEEEGVSDDASDGEDLPPTDG